ncbi:putative NAD dependent epimerase/dehydratase [Lipomyces doorenjongii]
MVAPNYAIPIGSKILVIGSNGYIGSHIVNVLLSLGYDVRGTVRTPRPWLDQYFKGKYGEDKFESVVLPVFDLDSLDQVMDGVSGVIHGSACNTDFSSDPNMIIPGVVKGALNILETALKHKSVTRVVLTSSSAACLVPKPGVDGIEITQETWN